MKKLKLFAGIAIAALSLGVFAAANTKSAVATLSLADVEALACDESLTCPGIPDVGKCSGVTCGINSDGSKWCKSYNGIKSTLTCP